MRVRKKPVEVEAEQVTEENLLEVAEWCDGFAATQSVDHERPHINIYTLEGTMRAEVGDWIIKGVNGEFYPCKPKIFEKTYDILDVWLAPAKLNDSIGNNELMIQSIIEHEDGSATVHFEMDQKLITIFAKMGIKKALMDHIQQLTEEERQ